MVPVLGLLAAAVSGTTGAPSPNELSLKSTSTPIAVPNLYEPCGSCGGCHDHTYQQHLGSMHSGSFSNPVFLAEYTQEVLPAARSTANGFRDARSCTACHAPVAHKKSRARLVIPDPAASASSSVTCDFCHTITGYRGVEPGNGNYTVAPGPLKFGPLRTRTDWHHHYSELQTKSEFCAICHSVRNQYGLDIKSTYVEWKESRYAADGIQCQDCHMSVDGFLTKGRAVHESGLAASMSLGSSPVRETLYTHRFQGARSQSQIEGAIQLAFDPSSAKPVAGETLLLNLLVDNSRTGHKMPSGSVELRFLWLEAYAEIDGHHVDLVPSAREGSAGYDVTGVHAKLDEEILAGAVPPGRRIYRTILVDRRGKATLSSHLAESASFDNRLNASEIRVEGFRLMLPDSKALKATLFATLFYVPYPDAFATRLGLPKAEPIVIASTQIEIALKAP